MSLKLLYSANAKADIRHHVLSLSEKQSKRTAERWFNRLIGTLANVCRQGGAGPESRECILFPFVIREAYFGIGRRVTHRVVFTVQDTNIYVVAVKHLAQQDIDPDVYGNL